MLPITDKLSVPEPALIRPPVPVMIVAISVELFTVHVLVAAPRLTFVPLNFKAPELASDPRKKLLFTTTAFCTEKEAFVAPHAATPPPLIVRAPIFAQLVAPPALVLPRA